MSYQWKQWLDHVTEFEDRYTESRNDDGTITHTPVEGEILQQGTPQNANNFNHMEDGISNAGELAALLAVGVIHQRQQLADMTGEVLTVSLTNSQQYPFNNSKKTVALTHPRNHLYYTVTAEVLEYSGGCVGDIEVTEKLVNGFKIEYTGSATSVTLKVFVKGGFY
ncbi:MAG: hypothetical protein BACD_02332 [Bacteroides rodentium]